MFGEQPLPHRHLRLQAADSRNRKRRRKEERPGERGLIDKKPGGRRHRPARANRSHLHLRLTPYCTTPAALPHREHPSALHLKQPCPSALPGKCFSSPSFWQINYLLLLHMHA
ncbi:hypothetical protein NC652_037199 [Populus alba x Populus x berolinensis]|nr:hypothetical protein NC652_037199 [Populus alba x Populus x berolinensis]